MATCEALLRRGETVRVVNRSGSADVPEQVDVVRGDASDTAFAHGARLVSVENVYMYGRPAASR